MFEEILKIFIERLDENAEKKKCCGLPQAAALFDIKTKEIIGDVYVNTKVGDKDCWDEKFQKAEPDTHAEIILLNNHKKEIINGKKGSLGIMITSHPCHDCLRSIITANISKSIENILFLSNRNAESKRIECEEKIDKEVILSSGLKLSHFNTNSNELESSLRVLATEKLHIYLYRYVMDFLREEFIEMDNENSNVKFDRSIYARHMNVMNEIESIAGRKFFNWKGSEVKIKLDKLKDWFNNDLDHNIKEAYVQPWRKHKATWK